MGGGLAALPAQWQGGWHRHSAPALDGAVVTSPLPAVKKAHHKGVLCQGHVWGWRSEQNSGAPNPQSLSARGLGGWQARPLPHTGLLGRVRPVRGPRGQTQTPRGRCDRQHSTRLARAQGLHASATRTEWSASASKTLPTPLSLFIAVSADS